MHRPGLYYDHLQERVHSTYRSFLHALDDIRQTDPAKYERLLQNTSQE